MTEEGAPGVTVGLVEAIATVKTSSPSAIASVMVDIVAVIVPPAEEVPDVNVTVNGIGSLKSAFAVKVHNNGIRHTYKYNIRVDFELDC